MPTSVFECVCVCVWSGGGGGGGGGARGSAELGRGRAVSAAGGWAVIAAEAQQEPKTLAPSSRRPCCPPPHPTPTPPSGGYSATSSTIKLFWGVVRGMDEADRGLLLRFATSVSRAPLGGFQHLSPPLTIHKARAPLPGPARGAAGRAPLPLLRWLASSSLQLAGWPFGTPQVRPVTAAPA